MGVFNMIETFFFISLAITFVLILLLVYHFKQRIITVEQKCDTMFDIINTMVQEIQYLRSAQQQSALAQYYPLGKFNTPLPVSQQYDNLVSSVNYDVINNDESSEDSSDLGNSCDEDDSEDEESESEDGFGNEDKAEAEKGDSPLIRKIVLLETIESSPSTATMDEPETIKIVNIDNEFQLENLPNEQEAENDNVSEYEELDSIHKTEDILVEKIEETVLDNNEDRIETNVDETNKAVYNKMTTSMLKQQVVQKGLRSDASKIKRPELLKLLESA